MAGIVQQIAVVALCLLGATIGTDREVEPAVGVGRPDVIAGAAAGAEVAITHEHQASTRRWTANAQPLPSIGAV